MYNLAAKELAKVAETIKEFYEKTGVYAIVRCQTRADMELFINNGKTERLQKTEMAGMGVQVFTKEGYSGFVSYDRIEPGAIERLLREAHTLAIGEGNKNFLFNREIFIFSPRQAVCRVPVKYPLKEVGIREWERQVTELNRGVSQAGDVEISVQTLNAATEEAWRIFRSDGTDVYFETPRSILYHAMTLKRGASAVNTSANVFGTDLGVYKEESSLRKLSAKTGRAMKMASSLLDAPRMKRGNYKILIDYAMAKGLAHEAFGHASESDHAEESVLAAKGIYRLGEQVASGNVSIVDGPVEGDYAYQPYSANGEPRQTVEIVKNGILNGGLGDIFSARAAGIKPSGAARAQSYQTLPLPRMSNIRLIVDNPVAVDLPFEAIGPEKIYSLLRKNGLAREDEKIIYLAGYGGGQVNPATGDFVFNCSGVYDLSERPVLYQPAIFSGKILSALKSILGGIGPLEISAIGTCGKMGQGVPSSGGGNYFILMDKNDETEVGGE